MYGLDGVDLKIIDLLQENARITLKDIAANVFLPSPAVSARIEKLERAGVIEGYHARINREAFSLQIKAFISVKTDQGARGRLFEYIRSTGNVIQCDWVTGEYDLFLEVLFHDTQELDRFLDGLGRFGETRTQIVFSSAVEHRGLPVQEERIGA